MTTMIFFGTKHKAQAGWPKCLTMVWATPREKFAVFGDQLWQLSFHELHFLDELLPPP